MMRRLNRRDASDPEAEFRAGLKSAKK